MKDSVVELTLRAREKRGCVDLKSTLNNLKALRKKTSVLSREYTALARNATTAIEARQVLDKGLEDLELLYSSSEEAMALTQILDIQKELRRIPAIDLTLPTVVLIGSPNVGKSSIVRAVSTGTPEVNDYPFTTRGVSIGHIVDKVRDLKFQVMDTPGLLDRPEDDRNEMERLTFASLAHLPTAVIFVIDPSGLSGEQSTLQAQLNVRNYLKSRFPKRPWLDVMSKGDLDIADDILNQLPIGNLPISVHNGLNIEYLKNEIDMMLMTLQRMLHRDK